MARIPKTIHYCWVGGAPKPESVLRCIESWKKHCPDYEIREWNESNYDFSCNAYMKQAYEAKKWGFVPDYARLDIIYRHGGIYLDTDVEMIKSMDSLLDQEAFMGFENTGDGAFFVNCGHGFGAIAGHEIIRAARDAYEHIEFLRGDGSLNMLASPHYTTETLKEFGLQQENQDQKLPGMMVYASDVLCPKTFRTGKLNLTRRSVSIHHFTASWLDEKIRKEMLHMQRLEQLVGKRMMGYILLVESVLDKYTPWELITRLPLRLLKKAKQKAIGWLEVIPCYARLLQAACCPSGKGMPVLLDTSLDSDNCGDAIIMENCILQLADCMQSDKLAHAATHRLLTEEEKGILRTAGKKILCGTNILSGRMRHYGLWRMEKDIRLYRNTVLMGVGFDSQSQESDRYSKWLLRTILSKDGYHSVRDSFSEQKLKSMGIKNVLNTGCPTMWCLTPEHCASIPKEKAKHVVCTITDYCRDEVNDKAMLDILLDHYEKVYFWIQGCEDLEYLKELGYEERVILIPSTVADYDAVLEQNDLDYVGTRLHAGIRAIAKGHRSLIISIDNRAECIGADTGLPVLKREAEKEKLREYIYTPYITAIQLPWENIADWKSGFAK